MISPIADMYPAGLCPLPHVASTVRVIDEGGRAECSARLRTDEVLLTRQAREIGSLSATVTALRSALASERAAGADDTSGVTVVRPITHDPIAPEITRIMPAERTMVSGRPEIRQYVLPTVFTNNGSLIDVFA